MLCKEKNYNAICGAMRLDTDCLTREFLFLIIKALVKIGKEKKFISVIFLILCLQDLSLRGFWLQKWLRSDKVEQFHGMIDYLLGLVRDGKLTYEYAFFNLLLLIPIPSSSILFKFLFLEISRF